MNAPGLHRAVFFLGITMAVGCGEADAPKVASAPATVAPPAPPAPPPRPASVTSAPGKKTPARPVAPVPVEPTPAQQVAAVAATPDSTVKPTASPVSPAEADPRSVVEEAAAATEGTAPPASQPAAGPPRANKKYPSKSASEAFAQFWAMEDRANFYKFQTGMKQFQDANRRRPENEAEFMREIMQKYDIALPKPPAGQVFYYDPELGQATFRSAQPGATSPPVAAKTPPAAPTRVALEPAPLREGDDTQRAKAGVGKKGRNYGGGIITEPIKQRFQIEDRLNFMKMEKGIADFKILNERFPKNQQEFMSEIIEKNAVRLPELPPGDEYVYDAKKGELMVRHNQSTK